MYNNLNKDHSTVNGGASDSTSGTQGDTSSTTDKHVNGSINWHLGGKFSMNVSQDIKLTVNSVPNYTDGSQNTTSTVRIPLFDLERPSTNVPRIFVSEKSILNRLAAQQGIESGKNTSQIWTFKRDQSSRHPASQH
ncbi:hypothetical protein VNI00_012991 [Paramarasmius palmivorus]|uniref:Uncharacterized protein n=1 Tax=Paramarasmius palmivorus TaxID=297713 RepID=A0AAW0C0A6_9AGAR